MCSGEIPTGESVADDLLSPPTPTIGGEEIEIGLPLRVLPLDEDGIDLDAPVEFTGQNGQCVAALFCSEIGKARGDDPGDAIFGGHHLYVMERPIAGRGRQVKPLLKGDQVLRWACAACQVPPLNDEGTGENTEKQDKNGVDEVAHSRQG